MHFRTYSVNANGQLQVVNAQAGTTASTEVLVADVVKLHAQYGVSSAVGVQDIQKWVEPVAGGTYETNWNEGNLDADKVTRIKAVRLAIVMRSPRLEAGVVTGTCTTAGGVVNNGPCAWEDTVASPAPQIDLSADANWQRYRYRVFQTIVPVRNIISAGV
jgi:type IV pilus assembly protein PilW